MRGAVHGHPVLQGNACEGEGGILKMKAAHNGAGLGFEMDERGGGQRFAAFGRDLTGQKNGIAALC